MLVLILLSAFGRLVLLRWLSFSSLVFFFFFFFIKPVIKSNFYVSFRVTLLKICTFSIRLHFTSSVEGGDVSSQVKYVKNEE